MFIEKENYYYIEEMDKLGINAIFSKKNAGNMSPLILDEDEAIENREAIIAELNLPPDTDIFYARQTHSKNIHQIKDIDESDCMEDIDGFITHRKDVLIIMHFADCLPIYYYDPKKEIIGVVHAGWKGSLHGIQLEMIKKMQELYNCDIEDIIVGMGVGIKGCCYEVQEDFYNQFAGVYNDDIIKEVFEVRDGKLYFNNVKFNELILLEVGVKFKNLIVANECTFCSDKFHSYRKHREKSGRNAAFMSFK